MCWHGSGESTYWQCNFANRYLIEYIFGELPNPSFWLRILKSICSFFLHSFEVHFGRTMARPINRQRWSQLRFSFYIQIPGFSSFLWFSDLPQICRFLVDLLAWIRFQAIKTRFLRFYPKPTAFEAIEPNIGAVFCVSALHSDQGAVACPKWDSRLKPQAKKISRCRHNAAWYNQHCSQDVVYRRHTRFSLPFGFCESDLVLERKTIHRQHRRCLQGFSF